MVVWELFLWSLCLLVCVNNAASKTTFVELHNPTAEEVAFLHKYGYMEPPPAGVSPMYTAQSVAGPVRAMQAFAGLPATGLLDPDTRKLFKMKRCGMKDIEVTSPRSRRYILQQGWNKKSVTYRVLNGSSTTLPKHRVESLMAAGLAVWAPHGGLRFSRLDRGNADIEVSFAREDHGDGFPFDGPGHVVAHAFQPPHGEMHFDDDELWGEDLGQGDENDDVTDFFAVAVHEIGHALGLSHSNVRESVMYPYYQVPVEKLHPDDILGMQQLYMTNELSEEAPPEPTERPGLYSSSLPRFTKASVEASEEDEENEIPDLCYTNYDTIQAIQGKLFVFEEEWMWVIKDKVIQDGFPRRFHEVFRGLPRHINSIRAIYEKLNGNIVIFYGKKYWEFNPSFRLVRAGRLTDYGLPRGVRELSAAFLSNYNNKTYLFDEERFWRYDDAARRLDRGYPKRMAAWRHVPSPVDAALVWRGDTFFFRGPRFWRFDNTLVRAHRYYPLPTAQLWFPCPPSPDMRHYFVNEEP